MPDIIDELRYEMDRIHDLKDRAQGAEYRLRKKCQRLREEKAELLAALKDMLEFGDDEDVLSHARALITESTSP